MGKLRLRLRSLLHRRAVEQELDEEFQFHLDRQIEQFVARGMDPREARSAALRAIGGIDQHKEAVRDTRGVAILDNLMQDLRYASRTFRRSRGFALLAIFTLTVGIGGITAIFSVVNGVLLQPLPYEHAERLVSIAETRSPQSNRPFAAPPDGADWKDRQETAAIFESLTWLESWRLEAPERIDAPIVIGARVPPNYFSTVGSKPQLGRDFRPDDASGSQPAVAILSHPYWQNSLAGDPNVVGRTVKFSSGDLTVIGVMPPAFRSPFFNEAQIWAVMPQDAGPGSIMVARLRPGIKADEAQTRLGALIKRIAQEYPSSAGRNAMVQLLVPVQDSQRTLLLLLFGSVGLILLMSVLNVGNLLLSRALTRGREVALRSALGAGQRRLVRQFLAESLLLALPGGVLGLAAANAGAHLLITGLPQNFPRLHEVSVDSTVMSFALITTVIASIAFGLFPVFTFAGLDLQDSLKSGVPSASQSGRSLHLRRLLVAAEVGLSMILLIAASLTAKSFWNLLHEPLGIETKNVIVANFLLRPRPEPVRAAFYEEVIKRIGRYPEVDSVSLSSHAPLRASFFRPPFAIEGRSGLDDANAVIIAVTPDYFQTLRIRFAGGRSLEPGEHDAVINETMARRFWPNSDPIGSRIKPAPLSGPWLTVVGVIHDERLTPGFQDFSVIYRSCGLCGSVIVKTRDDSSDVATIIRRELADADNTSLVTAIQTAEEIAAESAAVVGSRFQMALFLAFAGAGLLLAVAGVYGVTSYAAAQRTKEVGIRLALGATRFSVLAMMMRQSMIPILAGISAGLLGALSLSRFLESYLFGVTSTDVSVFVAVPLFLVVIAMIANFIPVHRGTRIDPTSALKYE
jgi:putative ABC transport system permease protein